MRRILLPLLCLLISTQYIYGQTNTFPATGNVGIGTTSPNTSLQVVGTTLNSTANVNYYHNVASYNYAGSSITGTMEISLPNGWTNTMMSMVIKGYNYDAASGWEVHVSGYNYSATPAWYNYKAEIIGSAPFNNVRLAYNSATSKNVVLLGTTSTNWSYPKIGVTEFTAGHLNINGWGNGWAIAPITNESTITNSVAASLATYLTVSGNFLIGKTSQTNSSYKLDVNGDARANKLVVNTTGADYVFDSSYRLLVTDSLESFIKKNHHLPGVPSADEMQQEGLDVGDNEMTLLKKIEELTLIVIEQNKRIKEQNKRIEKLEIKLTVNK